MATLVLTAVGSVFGPVGAAVGGLIGSAIDREVLFKPKGREGPRLQELRVQSSSYGTQIPRLFGTMRVAGSVIWATDLVEHRSSEGGKGRPTVTSYSYTASFAVALSARPIRAVRRIWADGKLLRGAAGDWKSATGFRLHMGGEDEPVDPLIAAAEGQELAPAHRGIAYAVFEDMALADYGNRIPSLTFEVEADAAPVAAGAVLQAVAPELRCDEATPALSGFSAHGASVRSVAETLAGAAGGWFRAEADRLAMLCGDTGSSTAIPDAGARAPGRAGARGQRSIAAAEAAPRALSLSYYDPARDHQVGVQRATRPGAGSREVRLELPAAVDAGTAKTLAEAALARHDAERERRVVTLGWDALAVRPGERVTIAGVSGVWRVERWLLEHMTVRLECVAVAAAAMPARATSGRVVSAPDRVIGATVVHAFELPPLGDTPSAAPQLAIAAAGTAPGWRSAVLLVSTDDGASWSAVGGTAAPACLGHIAVPPGGGPAEVADLDGAFEVVLAHDAMTLADADAAALAGGANLAMVGEELLQFGRAAPLGEARWRLSMLWRGRRGTEGRIGSQAAGDRFVLLAADALVTVALPIGAIGAPARVLAQGAGDASGAAESLCVPSGVSIRPPAPVHVVGRRLANGRTAVSWIRRSRTGWDWSDGVDAPLGEERERYRVEIGGAAARTVETEEPFVVLEHSERATAVNLAVRQIGSLALSEPAMLILPPLGDEG